MVLRKTQYLILLLLHLVANTEASTLNVDGWYTEFSLTRSSPKVSNTFNDERDFKNSDGFSLIAGYYVRNWLALEVSLSAPGDITKNANNISYTEFSYVDLSSVFFYEIERFTLYTKVGLGSAGYFLEYDDSVKTNNGSFPDSISGASSSGPAVTFGLGALYNINHNFKLGINYGFLYSTLDPEGVSVEPSFDLKLHTVSLSLRYTQMMETQKGKNILNMIAAGTIGMIVGANTIPRLPCFLCQSWVGLMAGGALGGIGGISARIYYDWKRNGTPSIVEYWLK